MTEVEAKAPVAQVGECKVLLDHHLGATQEITKYDTYYSHPTEIDLRIRCTSEGESSHTVQVPAVLTAKKKGGSDKMECNREVEVSVDSSQYMEDLLLLIGYTPYIQKKKFCYRWERNGLVYELVEVASLGWFLEIEKVIPSADPRSEDVAQAYQEVVHAFSQLGISSDTFEDRYYTDMLKELEAQK